MSESAGKPAVYASQDELVTAVYDAVTAAGMSFPFPQREVLLLDNSAEHELDPGVDLLITAKKTASCENELSFQ